MEEKQLSLSKQESDRLTNLLSVAKMQEELLNAITSSYKEYIITVVFKRLGIDPKHFLNTTINLNTGEIIIKTPPPVPQPKPTPGAKGDKT